MGCVYFVRHGETVWNVENKICGSTDIDLTQKGHEQAIETGKKILNDNIKADKILYSPLIRAKKTAMHISEITGIPAFEEPRLTEQNFGKFEFVCRYDGGESMLHLAQRIYNLLDDVKASGENCILVAHNGISRVINSYFYEMTNIEYANFGVKNCAVLKYEFE